MSSSLSSGAKGRGANGKPYKTEIQREGISEQGLPKGVPSNANPVTKNEPGLGGATLPHPYRVGKYKTV